MKDKADMNPWNMLFRLNKHYRSEEDYEKWKNDLKFMVRSLAPKPMRDQISFEEWNCFPRLLKKSVDDRTLEAIENNPNDFTYFDDGTVMNYVNIPIIESTDYEP